VIEELVEQQQQQQQQKGLSSAAATMSLPQLQQLLAATWPDASRAVRQKTLMPFHAWSNACRSSDVRTLLQRPAVLLQLLQQCVPDTAATYLRSVRAVLQVPAVAALLPPSETAGLLQQLKEATQQYNRARSTRSLATAAMSQCFPTAQQQQEGAQQESAVPVQQQQCDPAATIELGQLQQLLSAAWSHKGSSAAACALLPFHAWASACGSTDVRVLLQRPQALLQQLQQRHSASSAAVFLSHVLDVLALPAVAGLLSQAALASLVQQLTDTRKEYELVCGSPTERAGAVAAAVAAAALAGSGLVPAAKRLKAAATAAVGPQAKQKCSAAAAAAVAAAVEAANRDVPYQQSHQQQQQQGQVPVASLTTCVQQL
jgi:hypothetical protein